MDSHIEVEPGAILDGRYRVLDRLGSGTMAYVVRAHDTVVGIEVACKIPLDTSAYKADALLAQYKKLCRLNSRHLPAVLGYEQHRTDEPHFPFLVMEVVSGTQLVEWHAGKPLRKRLEVLAGVAETLAALGAPHGDLDANNILVASDDRVVLIDPDAESFGSSRSRATGSSERTVDLVGLRAVMEGCISPEERARLAIMWRRIESSDHESPKPGEIAAGLRNLLSLPLLPGETSASLSELAASYQKRTDDARATFGRICDLRDLAFRNATDLLRRLAEPFELVVPDRDAGPVVNDRFLLNQEHESGSSTRGKLNYRQLSLKTSSGDELLFAFEGKHGFRLPWPHGSPGLLDRGWFNLVRDNDVIATNRLELYDIDGVPRLFVVEPGRSHPFDEPTIDRALRILFEFIYPAVKQPSEAPNRTPADPALPVPDLEFLVPSFSALEIPRPESPAEWLRAATATALRLPENSKTGNGIFGSALGLFFGLPDEYDARLKLVKAVASSFLEKHGQFFAPLYRFDVRVVDQASRRLQVDLEGRVHGGEIVSWRLEFATGSMTS
jgi:predicted Ser/Thr protein kinase